MPGYLATRSMIHPMVTERKGERKEEAGRLTLLKSAFLDFEDFSEEKALSIIREF